MSAKVVDSYVKRTWKFSFNIEPGSVPDMPPARWSQEIMRPTSVKLTIETFPDRDLPAVGSVKIFGPKVLKGGKMSEAITKVAHLWSYHTPPAWVDELSQEALNLATQEMYRSGLLARNQSGEYVKAE